MNSKTILAAALVLGLFASSCKKDVFNQKKLTGTWEIQEYKVGNVDLFTDSISATLDGNVVKTKFNSASIIFEEDGDFTQYISYGFNITSSYSPYSFSGVKDTSKGYWSNVNTDLLLSFDLKDYNSVSSNSGNYINFMASPMNGLLITGREYSFEANERYDITSLVKDELEMEGLNGIGQKVYIKAIKK